MKSSVLPLRWLLAAAAAGSIIAAACVANAGDDAPANDAAPPAETAAQAAPSAADAVPAEPAAAAPAAEPSAAAAEPPHPAPRAAAHAAHTVRKDAAAGAAAGRLSDSLAKAFYTFADVAAFELAPNLTVAWGIGAPRGEYVIRASIWASSAEGASELSTAELRSGGALRSAQAIRAVGGATAERAWLEAFGETGAHGVTYDLLLWNGDALVAVVGHFTSAPGNVVAPGAAAQLRDLNGDGEPELVIDRTDPYQFYYTSQIWHADAAVLRRAGDEFREVTLTLPRPGVSHAAMAGARSALAFARAGWWPYALEQAEAALALAPDDPRLAWNAIVIRERGSAALREAERSAVPWLGYLLAGDWQRARRRAAHRPLPRLARSRARPARYAVGRPGARGRRAGRAARGRRAHRGRPSAHPGRRSGPPDARPGPLVAGRGHNAGRRRAGRGDSRLLARDAHFRSALVDRLPRRLNWGSREQRSAGGRAKFHVPTTRGCSRAANASIAIIRGAPAQGGRGANESDAPQRGAAEQKGCSDGDWANCRVHCGRGSGGGV